MSPRKTRRGKARGDNVDESVSTTIDESLHQLESPSVHSRSLRARRNKDSKEVPTKTPKKSLLEIVESSPQPVRRTRGRQTLVEPLDQSNVSLNTTAKKRGRKPKNSNISDDENPENKPDVPEIVKKPRATRGKKKLPNPGDEITIDDSPEPPDSDDNEVANVSAKILTKSAPTKRFRQLRGKEVPPNDITPESSPITIPLTPHRTTKTPRKSPVNLSSPKTHSLSPQRLSKTPRKLSVISASPVPSDSSTETPKKLSKTPPKLSSSKLKNRTTLHSKTPKIVLRKSKSKSPPSARSSKIKRNLKNTSASKKSPKSPQKSNSSQSDGEISDNLKSPQLILKRINQFSNLSSTEDLLDQKEDKSSPSGVQLTSRLHSLVKSELRSSTPRERAREIRKSLNLSSGSSPLNVEKFYGPPRGSRASKSLLLEDESNPLITDDDSFQISGVKPTEEDDVDKTKSIHKDNTYELAEPKTPNLKKKMNKEQNDNNTYELDEPMTPGLRKQTGKRSLQVDGESPNEGTPFKRVCRVRFASPDIGTPTKTTPKVVMRSRSATPSSKLMKRRSPSESARRRSNSMSNLAPKSPASALKNRATSAADVSGSKWSQKAQNESINRLSRPRLSTTITDTDRKKMEAKGVTSSSAKKLPNFAQIHQKKFEKMESLVDAKKRIEMRHNALTSNNFSNIKGNEGTDGSITIGKLNVEKHEKSEKIIKASIMTEPKAGFNRFGFKVKNQLSPVNARQKAGYNRFGFKLNKQEATKIISRPIAAKLEERKEVKRMVLKGVRTNKRFELLMKSRNLK